MSAKRTEFAEIAKVKRKPIEIERSVKNIEEKGFIFCQYKLNIDLKEN